MLDRVSSHAILRYLERVLGLPVDEWLVGMDAELESKRVAVACERAGLPVDAVRELILHPAVLRVVASGFADCIVRLDGFAYVIKSGRVITILTGRMRDERIGQCGKVRELDRASMRREILKKNRRHKAKHRNRDRQLAEVD